MAGERKGITCEAILYVVLERLRTKGKLKGKVFWNETPDGMTIEPDLLVGPDKDHPTAMFLVTHSGSAKESEKKFWRNMGELVEAKTQLATVPRVYNVAFDSIIKESLKKVQAAAFDGQLIAGDEGYGTALQAWVDANNKSLPKDRFEKADAVKKAADGKGLATLIAKLEADVAKLVGSTNPRMKSVWALERARPKGKAPTARDTFVRRGLSKLLVFEDVDLALRLYGRQRVEIDEVPEYAFLCGLARKSIGRAVPADREVLNATSIIDAGMVESFLKKKPTDTLNAWLSALRSIENQAFIGSWLVRNFSIISNEKALYKSVVKLHKDEWALVSHNAPNGWPPKTVWLFEAIVSLIKISTGNKAGYGYAQLGRELVQAGLAQSSDLSDAGQFGGGLGLSAWLKRELSSPFRDDLVRGCCSVLSARLSAMGKKNSEKHVEALSGGVRDEIMGNKLVSYRGIDPLFEVISTICPHGSIESVRTCFAEAAQLGGQAGKTRIYRTNNTLINWQSAHGSHTNDKKKELCGRAVGLRYSWDAKTKTFIKRSGVDKLILVVDGTWTQSNLDALVRAGWDKIFYPDEMDQLAAAIV